jgi:hypothetical protein
MRYLTAVPREWSNGYDLSWEKAPRLLLFLSKMNARGQVAR